MLPERASTEPQVAFQIKDIRTSAMKTLGVEHYTDFERLPDNPLPVGDEIVFSRSDQIFDEFDYPVAERRLLRDGLLVARVCLFHEPKEGMPHKKIRRSYELWGESEEGRIGIKAVEFDESQPQILVVKVKEGQREESPLILIELEEQRRIAEILNI